MRLPLSWLRYFVDYTGTPDELADRLGTSGFEIEGIRRPGAPNEGDNHANFVIGRVEHFEKHPNADRLRVCKVDAGDGIVQVVCGAPNARTGMKGVFAPAGTHIPGTGVDLKKGVIRGEESNGMLLSERELGL